MRCRHTERQATLPGKCPAIVLVGALACLACGSRAVVDGKLTAPGGGTGTTCAVELHYEVGDPGTGLRCQEPGAPGQDPAAAAVRIGQRFECVTVANGGAVDVTASCDGYEPYRSPPIRWSGRGSNANVHLGDIVLKPATETAVASPDPSPAELIGTWRGTSTCTDRVAAPACHDEVVVYDFTAGEKPGTVRWTADKVVDGQREPMGEFDLVYDAEGACWAAEFSSPRVRSRWCLVVDGAHLTGTGRLLPGRQTIREIDVRKD